MANEMILSNGFVDAVGKDWSEAFAIANPAKSATLTQIINKKGTLTDNNTVIQKVVKTLSKTTYSGGKAEGAAAGDAEKTKNSTVTNYMEIFSKKASVSGTANAMNSAKYAEELNDRTAEIKEDINKAILTGVKSDSDPRKMCGMINYTGVGKVELAGAALTEAELDTAIQKLNTKGDVFLAVNPVNMFALQRELIGDKAAINLATSESVAGINVTKYISAQGVTITLYAESALPAGTYVLYDMDKVEYHELRGLTIEPLAKTGDSDSAQVVCEVSNIVSPASVVVITAAA